MGKYELLKHYFMEKNDLKLVLTMEKIEEIMDASLPKSAYKYAQWWNNSKTKAHPYSRAWTEAGYYTVGVNDTIFNKKIVFEKNR